MDVDLPSSVQDIADVIGRQKALLLVGRLTPCGSRSWRRCIHIPTIQRLTADHQLVRILGWDDAQRLVRVFGGEILQPATCRELLLRWRDMAIRRLYRRGYEDLDLLASWFGLSYRRVRFIINGR